MASLRAGTPRLQGFPDLPLDQVVGVRLVVRRVCRRRAEGAGDDVVKAPSGKRPVSRDHFEHHPSGGLDRRDDLVLRHEMHLHERDEVMPTRPRRWRALPPQPLSSSGRPARRPRLRAVSAS